MCEPSGWAAVDRDVGDLEAGEQNGSFMGDVHVRVGEYRYAYHTDPDCPALNGKSETFKGRIEISRKKAEAENLKPCRQCGK
ncbi:hypothetical protein ACIA6T_16290 [Streptomyces sp. NPDC051740]|uniref:hypothetical protein n=1 Tax=Streptomyces sp. NPDC051740 TaxID=3365673 RepID=UPI0037B00A10